MNKVVKTLLLMFASVFVVGAVLYFFKTIVAPPTHIKIDKSEPFIKAARQKIDGISAGDIMLEYSCTADMLEVYQVENFLGSSELKSLWDAFMEAYVPPFAQYAEKEFMNTRFWPTKKTRDIYGHCSELASHCSGLPSEQGKIKGLETLYDEYGQAWTCSQSTTFLSEQETKRLINQSKHYATTNPFAQNKYLREALLKVPNSLQASHYRYLKRKLDELGKYKEYKYRQKTDYENKMNAFDQKLEAYKQMVDGGFYTGDRTWFTQLSNDFASYDAESRAYFKMLESFEQDFAMAKDSMGLDRLSNRIRTALQNNEILFAVYDDFEQRIKDKKSRIQETYKWNWR